LLKKCGKRQCFVLRVSADARPDRFFFLCGWTPRAGSYPFRANIIRTAVETSIGVDGTVIQMDRDPFKVVGRKDPRYTYLFEPPFSFSRLGMFTMMSEDSFSADIIIGNAGTIGAAMINFHVALCCYRRLRFDRFLVKDSSHDLHSVNVTAATLLAAKKDVPENDADFLEPKPKRRREDEDEDGMAELIQLLESLMDNDGAKAVEARRQLGKL